MTITLQSRVALPANVLMREIEGESVLLNLDSEAYFGLDEVGTRMLALVNTAETVEAAVAPLLEEYDVSVEQLTSDLLALLTQLAEHELVTVNAAEVA